MEIEQSFMELFAGLEKAHGMYTIQVMNKAGKKQGIAKTIRETVTKHMWASHLRGERGLGIIPINADSKCRFGAIDVDIYFGLDIEKIRNDILKYSLPLYPCLSKSGGVHIYLFAKEWVPAILMQSKLKELASGLGFGNSEIFPKQTEILTERGDIGQWINMPYYGNTRRWNNMPPEEFVTRVKRLSEQEIALLQLPEGNLFKDGPPCLQHLSTSGFPKGTRNDGLFNIGVYLRKKNPDGWKSELESYNRDCMQPPLSLLEVQVVIKSVGKKQYRFTCSKPPIAPHCNAALCKTRKYGIDNDSDVPVILSLTKFDSKPPTWFADVDGGGRIELDTADLQSQRRFQLKCMETLNTMPQKMTEIAWVKLIAHLMENVNIITAPVDASPMGQLFEHLEKFCNGNIVARNRDELLLGKPWTDNKKHYFRIKDFMAFLERLRFRYYPVNKVSSLIRSELKGKHKVFNIKGKCVNCWYVPAFKPGKDEEFDTPEEVEPNNGSF